MTLESMIVVEIFRSTLHFNFKIAQNLSKVIHMMSHKYCTESPPMGRV